MKHTAAEVEALEALNDLALSFEKRGWKRAENGLAAGYAWVRLTKQDHEDAQAFLAVDPDANEDRYLYGPHSVTEDMLPAIAEAVSRTEVDLLRAMDAHVNAAHSAAHTDDAMPPIVPPTSAAHTQDADAMPPIQDSDAAHNAAHRIEPDAAHMDPKVHGSWIEDDDAAHPVPPIENTDDDAAHLDDDARFVADEAKAHIRQVEESGSDAYSQQDVYNAVVEQQASHRAWSPVASELTDEVLLKTVRGKEISWKNSFSGRIESAVVSKDAEKHPARITPAGWNAVEAGDDLRILHFLELHGGFRSVAVSRITKLR